LAKNFSKISIQSSLPEIKSKYKNYVKDVNDAHIVAGAEKGKVRFLISYNIKDYNIEKINEDFGILVMRPAQFLQYLRSLR
jgi:predicted nucleic acid-binding protein